MVIIKVELPKVILVLIIQRLLLKHLLEIQQKPNHVLQPNYQPPFEVVIIQLIGTLLRQDSDILSQLLTQVLLQDLVELPTDVIFVFVNIQQH